jgi:hypothetical protein
VVEVSLPQESVLGVVVAVGALLLLLNRGEPRRPRAAVQREWPGREPPLRPQVGC